MNSLPTILIIFGAILILTGIILSFGGKLFGLGKFPGDIVINKPNFKFYFPITTSIIISIILSLILFAITKFAK